MNVVVIAEIVGGVAAFLAALTAIWKWLGIGRLKDRTSHFLDDWNGEPARAGRDAVPSFPERMTAVEKRTAALNHDMRGELASRLTLLEEQLNAVEDATRQLRHNGGSSMADKLARAVEGIDEVKDSVRGNREALAGLDRRLLGVDERITDHRRRNSEQVEQLRAEIEWRLAVAGDDQQRASAYRSALHEIGIDADPAPTRDDPGRSETE